MTRNIEEVRKLRGLYKDFLKGESMVIRGDRWEYLKKDIRSWLFNNDISTESICKSLRMSIIAHREVGLGQHPIVAILLYNCALKEGITIDAIREHYGDSIAMLVDGLARAYSLYEKDVAVENDNFRKLLMSIAADVRVVMVMIVERLDTMRNLQHYERLEQERIAREVSYLYAPMAHRLGLYAAKTELEDLSLKYTSNDIYKDIAQKLQATKRSRDEYISKFISPIKSRLETEGLRFEVKGRTKSIYSIWNKMKRQQVGFEKVYDLFAIRIIIDCDIDKEKQLCWQVFSIVTDMYTANTNRLRDWISVPKTNGYESLHATVMGSEGRWVEVQIRTKRMDEVAEKGLAAHWKYKGGKSDGADSDEWLKNLRDLLDKSDESTDIVDEFKIQLYNDEVFVFTPKGDLFRLAKGATVLDFAFHIHGDIGAKCMGALVNGRHATIRQVLNNGDQVKVLTSPTQKPAKDWLKIVKTPKARTQVRQYLKEEEHKYAENGREILLRRLKNWKMEYNDSLITRYAKKQGFKIMSDFYVAINDERVNLLALRDYILTELDPTREEVTNSATVDQYKLQSVDANTSVEALCIDKNLKGISYDLANCCNPIFGDDIFGFITVNGSMKIHKKSCPNAPQMISRFGYRVVEAHWLQSNVDKEYGAKLRIIGDNNLGIVANITSIISKQANIRMHSLSVDSTDNMFEGIISLGVKDNKDLDRLSKLLKQIKGVKSVVRE